MRGFALALSAAMAVTAAPSGQAQDPAALAARIQARYAAIKDFEGDFVQTYEGGVLRTRTTESGTLAVKQPGLFRFVYAEPPPEFTVLGLNVALFALVVYPLSQKVASGEEDAQAAQQADGTQAPVLGWQSTSIVSWALPMRPPSSVHVTLSGN